MQVGEQGDRGPSPNQNFALTYKKNSGYHDPRTSAAGGETPNAPMRRALHTRRKPVPRASFRLATALTQSIARPLYDSRAT